MRKLLLLPLLFFASSPHADPLQLPLTQSILEAMTPIDALPSMAALDVVFANATAANLQQIALITDGSVDFGVQLRAIRTLPDYCPPGCAAATISHTTLTTIISSYKMLVAPTPLDLLRLRAAIEALGLAGVSAALQSDVVLLTGFLDHTSRDVRATTAKALGTLCNSQAAPALRLRATAEQSTQVVLAISAALRDLALCPGS